MALDLELIDEELKKRGLDPEVVAHAVNGGQPAAASFVRSQPGTRDYDLRVSATNPPNRVSFMGPRPRPEDVPAPDLGGMFSQPQTRASFVAPGFTPGQPARPASFGEVAPLSNPADPSVQGAPRASFAKRYEDLAKQEPTRGEFPVKPLPWWKKILGAIAATAAGFQDARMAGDAARDIFGGPNRRAEEGFERAHQTWEGDLGAIAKEANIANVESEMAARENKPEPKLPESEQALKDYMAANNLEDTPANRDAARGAIQERSREAGKSDPNDKKIDEYTNKDGKRVLTFQRPDGTTYDKTGGAVKDVAAAPGTTVTGEAVLAQLSPADAALVKGIASYNIDPKTLSYRGGTREKFLSLVRQYDPSYDQTQYGARAAVRKDFESGKSAQNIRSLNTAIGHLNTLSKAAEELNNGGFQVWNKIGNWGLTQAGDPRTTKFNDAANAVVNEMASVFKGTGATDQEIKEWREQISSAQSPEQLRQGIQQLIQLMASRMEALDNQYQVGLGKPRDFRFLSPEARQILTKIGGSAQTLLDTDNRAGRAVASPAGPAGAAAPSKTALTNPY